MTRREETQDQGMPRGEQLKLRVMFIGGTLTAALGVLALAADELRRGTTSLLIGVVVLVIAVRRALWATVGDGADKTPYTRWYTAALGFLLMGAGAASTTYARRADTTAGEVILFLVAGVLLWAGVTCLIAAALAERRRKRASARAEGAT